MARKQQITSQLMDDLFVDLMGGDSDALNQYRDYARKLAKQINQQMLETERKGIETEAQRLAQDYLGEDRTRFKENVSKLSIDELQEQVDAMLSVRNTKDYSIPYAIESQQQIAKISEAMTDAGVDMEDAHVAYQMNELLKTEAWKEYKKAHGKSTNLIQAAQNEFQKGKTVDDLLSAYEDYKSGADDAPDLVESWEIFAPNGW